ncbi:MAG: hypothetical protein IPO48_19200 [Saprospiraceae bacterium]|nr:hypothetical protein [Saprospiraceae bacterium]
MIFGEYFTVQSTGGIDVSYCTTLPVTSYTLNVAVAALWHFGKLTVVVPLNGFGSFGTVRCQLQPCLCGD